MPEFEIRLANPADIAGIVALQRDCFPPPFRDDLLWQPEHIISHLQRFREGQFVAVQNDKIIASCTNMLVSEQTWNAHLDWESLTGGLSLNHHNPLGTVMYGIDISVHPKFRGQSVARSLYKARIELTESKNWQYATVCRLPGFSKSGVETTAEYAQKVVAGEILDQTLTPLLKIGLTYCGLISGYMEDPESDNTGAILRWIP